MILCKDARLIIYGRRIALVAHTEEHFLILIIVVHSGLLYVADSIEQWCRPDIAALYQFFTALTSNSYSLICSYSGGLPFLLVVGREEEFTVLVLEIGQHMVAIEERRGCIKQCYRLESSCTFL